MIDNTQTQSREDHEERDLMFGEIDKRNRVNQGVNVPKERH